MKLLNIFVMSLVFATSAASTENIQVIDVHCHNIKPEFVQFLERKGVALEETFPLPEWNVESHLAFMDSAGIQTAVLSMPAPQPYYGDIEETKRVIRQYNETASELKRKYPDRFMFVASLPLPDVEAAIAEAVYALDTLKADGVKNPETAPYAEDILRNNALRLFGKIESEAKPVTATQVPKLPMQPDGIVRLSRVEVYPEYLEEYLKMATEVGQTSLLIEPGVLTMYAVAEKDNPNIITILETYASQDAYKSHIASAHFQKYKQGTLHMVKDLRLLDQKELNPANHIINFISN